MTKYQQAKAYVVKELKHCYENEDANNRILYTINDAANIYAESYEEYNTLFERLNKLFQK
ncbi:MAG: hypothetical protein J6S67_13770 [Methanobrevibacter sp.]|nr:hypothetical protein [Methanobrevibacter sp.]